MDDIIYKKTNIIRLRARLCKARGIIMSLEKELGLVELTSIEWAYKEPTEYRMRQVSKTQQTKELVEYVVSNDGRALKSVSKKLITDELCKIAVQQNGLAIEFVPVKYITDEICDLAVSNNCLALEYIPTEYITAKLANKAVKKRIKLEKYKKYPIAYIPTSLLSEKLLIKAVKYSPHCLKDIPKKFIKKDIAITAVSVDGLALQYVPQKLISKIMIETSILNQPLALQFIPIKKVTKEICISCFERDVRVIQYIPSEYLSSELCEEAFFRNPNTFKYIPDEYKTYEMCMTAVKQDNFRINREYEATILFDDLPEEKRNDKAILDIIIEKCENGAKSLLNWNEQIIEKRSSIFINPLYIETVKYLEERANAFEEKQWAKLSTSKLGLKILELQTVDSASMEALLEPLSINCLPVEYEEDIRVVHNLADEDVSSKIIYYITDIHLEHQLMPLIEKLGQESNERYNASFHSTFFTAVDDFLDKKVQELITSAEDNNSLLLVGGDVASSEELAMLFYKKLSHYWKGKILFILGNHELWDGHSLFDQNPRTVDDIVNDYRERVNNRDIPRMEQMRNVSFLENDIYIVYKNQPSSHRIICEEQILNANNEELIDICSKASLIILGGIGFSGLNPYYNAELGLYRSTITSLEQDKELSERFYKIYEKLSLCARDRQVIVFTHTPVYDWTNKPCNANWIYINGHTHQNNLIREENDAIILSDNQIGYKPQKWKLNAVNINGWYNPFGDYKDGIHEITSEQYKDFNIGRGIESKGCNYQGRIYMLKHDGLYMFILEREISLYLLVGGRIKKLDHDDIDYYYNNMSLYGQKVREAIKPYQQFLEAISKEVKSFGGTGKIHGCIIDISWFSHIYVNPFDGKVTPYWALDRYSRLPYENIQKLLEENNPLLVERFRLEHNRRNLPFIDKYMIQNMNKNEVDVIPEWIFGTEMYEPSKVLRAVQYIWSQNVIRIWDEDILKSQSDKMAIVDKSTLTE